MTNIYQISLTESDFPDATEMLIALKKVMDSLSIEFFMLGSIARNIWLDLYNIPPNRSTKDIDFAMELSQQIDYETIFVPKLLENTNFTRTRNTFRFKFKDMVFLDIIPFSEPTIISNEHHDELSTIGLKEAYQTSQDFQLPNGQILKVTSLEAIFILKLIAFDDRPLQRNGKDDVDMAYILEKYFEINQDDLYENYHDILTEEELDNDNMYRYKVGARLLGRKIAFILQKSDELKHYFLTILEKYTQDNNRLTQVMYHKNNQIDYLVLLQYVLKGIQEKIDVL